jgi:hypothetical protein
MRVKFTANQMKEYQGADGLGGSLELKPGDEADVSDTVGKLLLQKYGHTFEVVAARPEHAPEHDKLYRATAKTKRK